MKLATAAKYGLGTAILSSQDGLKKVDAVSVMPFKLLCGVINYCASPSHEMKCSLLLRVHVSLLSQ
jgi:hypothetical protein